MITQRRLQETEARYQARAERREEVRRRAAGGRLLEADEPERVRKRLARLAPSAPPLAGPIATAAVAGADLIGLERLVGDSQLMGAEFLARGTAAARCVGRVVVRTEGGLVATYGTGFLASPHLLITNNHVLADTDAAARSLIEFDYALGADGRAQAPATFALEPGTFFVTDNVLDFTAVAVTAFGQEGRALSEFGWTRLIEAEGKVILHELLNIVQHPNGELKQLALRENRLVDLTEDFLHYETDTAPGSSGAPVFNDQWELVGLHHSGVPRRDGEGRILTSSGQVWQEAMGEDAIAWVANEGARVSRIVARLRSLPLSGPQAQLREELIAAAAQPIAGLPAPAEWQGATSTAGASPTALTLTIPVEITVRMPGMPASPPSVPTASKPAADKSSAGVAAPVSPPDSQEVRAALVELTEARKALYYDEAADAEAQGAYYANLDVDAGPEELFTALSELVTRTQHTTPRYKPHVHLYPAVDLQPNGQLKSIYTGEEFAPEAFIVEDARADQRRREALSVRLAAESVITDEARQVLEAALEAQLPFNCEHVVPQSWFAKKEPMRGDLHHLFACEKDCNSFRGNTPYFDFSDFGEVVRQRCGKREENRFEPNEGKGAAARATLYFLLRYPGEINRDARELEEDRLQAILAWHEAFPVSVYERHRNALIHAKQGNRNPFVDQPALAGRVALRRGLG